MLKALQIQELVKGGEGYNVDFKRSVPSKVKEISDEVASFANAAGGYVLIGVDNNNPKYGPNRASRYPDSTEPCQTVPEHRDRYSR